MYYSGHGSRRRARRPTKPSGKDATIISSDSGRGDDPNLDVIDDEIHAWLGDLSQVTSYITLVFDCCHSGTISRDVFGDTARWVEEGRTVFGRNGGCGGGRRVLSCLR